MDRGFYTSVSAIMCSNKRLGDISNNIANIGTVGYKKDKSTVAPFADLVMNKTDEGNYVGNMVNQINIAETFTSYSPGSLLQTGLPNDYAISGEGFFKIEKNGEYAYTRDGSFKVDVDGYLVTSDGSYVMGQGNNRIQYEEGKDLSNDLLVVNFDDLQTLKRLDYNKFVNEFGLSPEYQVDSASVKKGFLELSNVDAATELTDMISMQRYFQFNQRSLGVRDELIAKLAEF